MDIKLYTVKEVADILKCNRNRVYDLIHAGILPAIKIGSYKVTQQELNSFISSYMGKDVSNPLYVTHL